MVAFQAFPSSPPPSPSFFASIAGPITRSRTATTPPCGDSRGRQSGRADRAPSLLRIRTGTCRSARMYPALFVFLTLNRFFLPNVISRTLGINPDSSWRDTNFVTDRDKPKPKKGRAVSGHDSSHQLVISRSNSESFPGGADYPTYWVSILAGIFFNVGCFLLFSEPGPRRPGVADLARFARLT